MDPRLELHTLRPKGMIKVGAYSTRSRTLLGIDGAGKHGVVGQAGVNLSAAPYLPAPTQTTYSYRTSGEVDDSLQEDSRTTRNGFTTFDPTYDKGHEFWTESSRTELAPRDVYIQWRDSRIGQTMFYRGPLVPRYKPTISPVTRWSSSDLEARDYGNKAIKATSPLAPQASAAQFLGELLSSLPSGLGIALFESRANVARGAGGEYLNVQFGWIPFLQDLQKAVRALQRATTILEQLERDNGRNVRRRFAFPVKRESLFSSVHGSEQSGYAYTAPIPDDYLKTPASYSLLSNATRATSIWFSGCFTYAIPTDDSVMSRIREYSAKAALLLGARVDPSTVWELAPWSWLIDWKLGIGDMISNLSSLSEDGLVLRYGYLMRHSKSIHSVHIPATQTNLGWQVPPVTLSTVVEQKERIRATPYGFGLSSSSFTEKQWTILGALGLSKSPKSLH